MKQTHVRLAGSEPPPRLKQRVHGPLNLSTMIGVSFVVRRNKPLPLRLGATLGAGGARARVPRDQFAAMHGANEQSLRQLQQLLVGRGFSITSADPAARVIMVRASCGDLQSLFQIELLDCEFEKARYHTHVGPLSIPVEISELIDGVLGLDSFPVGKPCIREDAAVTAAPSSYTPRQVAQLYDFPLQFDGTGQSVGILQYGGGYKVSDLQTYFDSVGLPLPKLESVGVLGKSNSPGAAADIEVEADIEIIGSICPGATISTYFAPLTAQGYYHAVTTALADPVHNSVLSMSWGGRESIWPANSMDLVDSAMQDAVMLGVTVCLSSGDSGSDGGAGNAHVDFPACSPHVLACGGTLIEAEDGTNILAEVAWNDGGGGISNYFALPSWQGSAGVPVSTDKGHFQGRGVPDVSGHAVGYQLRYDGHDTVASGTSAVAPLWAALVLLVSQAMKSPAGYFLPLLYLDPLAKSILNDIMIGSNNAFHAGPGWDPCTGLGSPRGNAILQWFLARQLAAENSMDD